MAERSAARRRDPTFAELDVIRLRSIIFTGAATLPIGSVGTVVFRHDGADAYEVEFAEPIATVLTLRSSDLVARD